MKKLGYKTPEIKATVKMRNSLRKSIGQNRNELVEVEACPKVAGMIKEKKHESWKEYMEKNRYVNKPITSMENYTMHGWE